MPFEAVQTSLERGGGGLSTTLSGSAAYSDMSPVEKRHCMRLPTADPGEGTVKLKTVRDLSTYYDQPQPPHCEPSDQDLSEVSEEPRITAHVSICWLALLLIRVAEEYTGQT